MSDVCLDVTVRENTGTGGARDSRNNGFVPGVIYGGDEKPVAVAVKHNEVLKALNSGNFIASMIELSHEGKKQKVITKDIQFHPVTDVPMHVDFYRVTAKSIIEVEVNVNFTGEDASPGLSKGGTLNVVRYAIEVKCPAGSIPDSIDVDVSTAEIGDSIKISDVKLPKGVKPAITDRDFTIATLIASRAATEAAAAEGEEGEAEAPAAEGDA
ncbi:MAG: 50S ribosomal protein L25/general stress protein Ctc [Maricaulaceae bacterium]